MKRFWLTSLALITTTAFAQTNEPQKAELGRPLAVALEVPDAADLDLERTATDYFALTVKSKDARGGGKTAWGLELVPLAVGELSIPIYWKGADQPALLKLSVSEPAGLEPNAELHDIKRPARARPAVWPWLLALLAAAAAWYWWKNRKKGAALFTLPEEATDARTSEQIAKDELAALLASDLWPTGHFKEFYGRLTDVLRAYLERRLGVPALKLTTYELARHLRRAEIDREAVALFKGLFERADLVKFAKIRPASEQGDLDVALALKFIEATTSGPKDLAVSPGGPS